MGEGGSMKQLKEEFIDDICESLDVGRDVLDQRLRIELGFLTKPSLVLLYSYVGKVIDSKKQGNTQLGEQKEAW
jgi:hypothetical protein